MAGLEALWFPPPGMSFEIVGFLVFCSAMTSMLTATAGVGGGVLLFAIMAWVVPLTALIPMHGVVQIGSNIGRLLLMLRSVQLTILLPFLVGSVLGGALGAVVVVQLPPTAMQFALGAFILWAAWMKPPSFAVDRRAIAGGGLVITFLTMFFGATGPLIASMLKLLRLDRLSLVATQAACSLAQHGIKVAAFGLLGFAFAPYLPLIIAMIGAGIIGTSIGSHLLRQTTDRRFHMLMSCALTVLAMGLLAKGSYALIIDPGASKASVARSVVDDDSEIESRGSAVEKKHADGQGHAALWKAANRRLQNDLTATKSALAVVDWRADELAKRTRQDRRRIAALEREFEATQEQIDQLNSRVGKFEVSKRMLEPSRKISR